MDVCSLFVANAQPTELIEPCKGPFDHPPVSAQTAAVLGVTFSKQGYYVADAKELTDSLGVITPVTYYGIRPMARASSPFLQWWDGVNQHECLLRIIIVGACELDDQWDAAAVAD